jgi:hypothetical protein
MFMYVGGVSIRHDLNSWGFSLYVLKLNLINELIREKVKKLSIFEGPLKVNTLIKVRLRVIILLFGMELNPFHRWMTFLAQDYKPVFLWITL